MVIMSIDDGKEVGKMTNMQFQAMMKLCLTIAEGAKDIKDFKKALAFPDNGFGQAFIALLMRTVDNLGSMEKVRQLLKDIIMMEMEE